MPVQSFSTQVSADVPVVTGSETAAITSAGISTPNPGASVTISGMVVMTYGTGTTAVVVRIRRGSGLTGTIIAEADPLTVAAGNTSEQTFWGVDVPGDVASLPYTVTVQQTGASANGTVLMSELTATVAA